MLTTRTAVQRRRELRTFPQCRYATTRELENHSHFVVSITIRQTTPPTRTASLSRRQRYRPSTRGTRRLRGGTSTALAHRWPRRRPNSVAAYGSLPAVRPRVCRDCRAATCSSTRTSWRRCSERGVRYSCCVRGRPFRTKASVVISSRRMSSKTVIRR